MSQVAIVPVRGLAAEAAMFVCGEDESIWAAIEKALDNSYGFVFVNDATGALRGFATLSDMRQSLAKGGHLLSVKVGQVARPWGTSNEPLGVDPVFDAAGHFTNIAFSANQPFLARESACPEFSGKTSGKDKAAFAPGWSPPDNYPRSSSTTTSILSAVSGTSSIAEVAEGCTGASSGRACWI